MVMHSVSTRTSKFSDSLAINFIFIFYHSVGNKIVEIKMNLYIFHPPGIINRLFIIETYFKWYQRTKKNKSFFFAHTQYHICFSDHINIIIYIYYNRLRGV